MTGVRSCRKLEAACRDQIPFLWLTGWQHPDHNTLWRFYRAHRPSMRRLLNQTIVTAVDVGLVDLAVQAVDGTKVGASAAADRSFDAASLGRLLEKTEAAIAALEAQNEDGDDPPPPRLPAELHHAQVLWERARAAQERLASNEQQTKVNLTDGDARFMKGRQGIIPAYNAQAMASPVNASMAGPGLLITATDVVTAPTDHDQLIPMLNEAEAMTGEQTETTLADGGYHTAANLEAGDERGQTLVMSERYGESVRGPYFKDQFLYDETSDSYQCPEGQTLPFRSEGKTKAKRPFRLYRASRVVCRACPAFGVCTKDKHTGRALWIGSADVLLRRHRAWMETDEARALYARRKTMIEPVFGILKEQMAGRRFLLRGLANVRAEFALLAVAFNLRTLWRGWSAGFRATPLVA
jgi:IS5 family transposase